LTKKTAFQLLTKLRQAEKSLDSKAQKYVRRYLEKRRHAYRDRRVTRASRLLQDLATRFLFLFG
jgi:hypothetical protein